MSKFTNNTDESVNIYIHTCISEILYNVSATILHPVKVTMVTAIVTRKQNRYLKNVVFVYTLSEIVK